MTGVALVGCGRAGAKRAAALAGARLAVAADLDPERALLLAAAHEGCAAAPWEDAVRRDDVAVVVVSTSHDFLAPVALAALDAGKHVLVEKPGARAHDELAPVAAAARRHGRVAAAGYNHRFHPALQRARALLRAGSVGELITIRGRYGHGGRPGYEREWRCDPFRAGGGELLDQGVHLLDLARWFGGEWRLRAAHLPTACWEAPVEDNAFLLLEGPGRTAWLHASWTEWKNLFSFEVFGREGKLQVDGLGGSYGPERLTLHRMTPAMGPPQTTEWAYAEEDLSWRHEFAAFLEAVAGRPSDIATLDDALAVLRLAGDAYAQAGRPPAGTGA